MDFDTAIIIFFTLVIVGSVIAGIVKNVRNKRRNKDRNSTPPPRAGGSDRSRRGRASGGIEDPFGLEPGPVKPPAESIFGDIASGSPQESGSQSAEAGRTPRFCSQCGAPLDPGEKFCSSCGSRVDPQ